MLQSKRQLIMQEIAEADEAAGDNEQAAEDFQKKLEEEKRRQTELAM